MVVTRNACVSDTLVVFSDGAKRQVVSAHGYEAGLSAALMREYPDRVVVLDSLDVLPPGAETRTEYLGDLRGVCGEGYACAAVADETRTWAVTVRDRAGRRRILARAETVYEARLFAKIAREIKLRLVD